MLRFDLPPKQENLYKCVTLISCGDLHSTRQSAPQLTGSQRPAEEQIVASVWLLEGRVHHSFANVVDVQ